MSLAKNRLPARPASLFLGVFAAAFLLFAATVSTAQQSSNRLQDSPKFAQLSAAAGAAREQNNVPEALQKYRQALQLQPNWREGWWYVGSLEYQRDHYADALSAFQRLAELAPDAAPAWNFIGLCEFETGQYAEALQHLSKAQSLPGAADPDILRVSQYHLALLLIRSSHFEDASSLLHSLVGQTQPSPQIKIALGLAVLRVPLLPGEVDPGKDDLLQSAGDAASRTPDSQQDASLNNFAVLAEKYGTIPYVHYAYGCLLADAGRFAEALAEQQREALLSPQSALPQIGIAAAQLALHHSTEALEAARQAVRLEPDLAAAHKSLANILKAVGDREGSIRETAAAEQSRALETTPENRVVALYKNASAKSGNIDATNNLEDLFNQAMRSYSAHRYPEAISTLKIWIQKNPNQGTAWAVLGLSEFALKDYENALIHLQRGQQLGLGGSLDSVQFAKYRLALLLIRDAQFRTAEELLLPASGSGPLAKEVRVALGMTMLRTPVFPEDLPETLKPIAADAGEILEVVKESKYDQAFTKFESLLNRFPAVPFLHYAYGTALASLSRYDEAESQFRQEMVLSPKSELPFLRLASLALKKHRAAEAVAPALKAVALTPREAEGHYLLGRAYLESGSDVLAVQELETASQIAPASPEIHFNLAKAYARNKLWEKADRERNIFSQLNAQGEQQRSLHGSQSYSGQNNTSSPLSTVKDNNSEPENPPQK